ncbi:hypothetical protein ACP70R_033462 [Stipagrostis hirtigluma subsp. patula]
METGEVVLALGVLLPALLRCSSLPPAGLPPPPCAASRAPVMLGDKTLSFCDMVTGLSCCDAAADAALREEFDGMNISGTACAAAAKFFLCAACVPSLSAVAAAAKLSPALICAPTTAPSASTSAAHDTTLCLERISASGSYVAMAAHPDGSARVFLSTRDGKIWLADMPKRGSGGALAVGARPFLDLTDRVLALAGAAFHPDFATNGRFFVSYSCDSAASPACGGGTSCRFQLVVAEFSAARAKAAIGDYSESWLRPCPQSSYSYQNHGGQILFRPGGGDSGYLYLITGHGDFSKNRCSDSLLWGKIIRLHVGGTNNRTSRSEARMHEIVAMGLDNPSGCTFDSERPSHLYCGNVDERQHERVYYLVISKGGNHAAGSSSKEAAISVVINHGRPPDGRMPTIVGGLVYRGSADSWFQGRYLYVYASGVWAGPAESSSSSIVHYTSGQIRTARCAAVPCRGGVGISGRVLSLGEGNSKDAIILATGGVYRVAPPGLCVAQPWRPPAPAPAGTGWILSFGVFGLALAFYMVWSAMCGGGQIAMSCCNGWFQNCCNGWFHSGVTSCSYARRPGPRPRAH